jgi:hypothetical protein
MNANQQPKSANFNFLAKRYPDLERIGALCERYFSDDPIVALITLRQFGELLAQMVAARSGLLADPREQQADLLRRLRIEANYPPNVLDLFHQIRVDGNAATHRRDGDHAKALACLKMARQLGIWFYRTFDDRNFRSGTFAEWPTPNGPADYALFVGIKCIALVEAKRKRKNVQAAIDQTGRYAQGFVASDGIELPEGGPWRFHSGPTKEPSFCVPFLFATNGRPYLKQVETQSGIWFRDARHPTNLRRALSDWPTPEGLTAELNIDRQAAQGRLASLPIEFSFPLRDYQKRAIHTVENALANDANRTMLLAMATGTGKTKLAIALLYRLLETRRFRRVCFVVDRHALGEQAANEFKTIRW